ncbi:MAG: Rieske 2Fe-2S domain-containing protein [Actinomycetes bacterium]|jgi:ubiquinol-cytochrome c reductase iron-sulfur subunit
MSNSHGTDLNVHAATGDEPVFPLPPHHHRLTDTDPRAAKRAERQIATMFILSALGMVGFVVAYVMVPTTSYLDLGPVGVLQTSNLLLGLTFGTATLLIGVAAIHWAKKLMADEEIIDHRHPVGSTDEDREEALAAFNAGVAESGFAERPLLRRTLIAALALFPIPLIVLLKDMGPLPGDSLRHTIWRKGSRIVIDVSGQPLRPEDMSVGSLVSASPADLNDIQEAEGNQNARAKASIILVRMKPGEIVSEQGEGWSYQGILAFSKICTHVGCPIALYQQRTHHLLCPCHQSTFDLADSGAVVFGPAARRMPQLPITVDNEGYLVAQSDFHEPVGPSFWERP